MEASVAAEGATDGQVFETYVEYLLAPTFEEGPVIMLDDLNANKGNRTRELVEASGGMLFLPAYLPPEEALSKHGHLDIVVCIRFIVRLKYRLDG